MAHHFDLEQIEEFVRSKCYPEDAKGDKGKKRNFRRAYKNFTITNGQLMYKKSRLVIKSKDEQRQIIDDIHKGLGENPKAKAMSSHRGRDTTYQKVSERFFWHSIFADISDYVRKCEECQRHGKLQNIISPEMQSIPVPNQVMAQIGVDICNLPDVDGFKHLLVCIDYFSKWSEAKPLKDKCATSVACFLYEVICRHGCIKIQINDQGREFVNEVNAKLHEMTGVQQKVTSAYHPQTNGLCERQNRTIKDALVKILDGQSAERPYVIDGVLFAHRVSKHYSTKFSPFYLMYNREPILPIDVKYNFDQQGEVYDDTFPFDQETFDAIFSSALNLRRGVHATAEQNISKAQEKQRRDYNRRHTLPTTIKCEEKVWLKKQKRQDRKGGKFSYIWLGPYVVKSISKKGLRTLANQKGKVLRKKYNVGLVKHYYDPAFNKEMMVMREPL